MQHPFPVLKDEYLNLMASMKVTRGAEIADAADRIITYKPRYEDVSKDTRVPIVWLMATNERESGSKFNTYLGNGDRLSRRTVHVPAGRGPFDKWEDGAKDALHLDHIADVTDWDWARACFESELWNGFGPRDRGRHTGYLWSGATAYTGGKYVRDGVWSGTARDQQLGTVPLMRALVSLDASLDLPGWPSTAGGLVVPAPASPPQGLDGGQHGTAWLQASLNVLLKGALQEPLQTDGSYGRRTSAAVRIFQQAHGLDVDGLAGPLTIAAVLAALNPPVTPPPAPGAMKASSSFASNDPVTEAVAAFNRKPVSVPAGVPALDRTAAALCRGIYAYGGDDATAWDHLDDGSQDGVCWGLKTVDGVDFVVFRGSTTNLDWIRDAQAFSVNVPGLGPVHAGFNRGLISAWHKIAVRIGPKFVITGHSLGAGRASIMTGYAVRDGLPPLARVVFGEPRPGFAQLASLIAGIPSRSYRNGNTEDHDLITNVPFKVWPELYVHPTQLIDVCKTPPANDPWNIFSWHHMQLYEQALAA